jgi:hypothetical protein
MLTWLQKLPDDRIYFELLPSVKVPPRSLEQADPFVSAVTSTS